ncbi:MAG TPA: molybdenum cofactor biosynthesis protein MoaE [Aliidongia sp.]|uniref:molybdenum cofactor biosynthesis protein MoaE n=1 Tax=Aliidongia sp. TaxID=1914230 RepID=UPI002DDD76C5|nr:molybdenum cofactor biosynthesis protein MoaE [Aliidongia sp.]HEV2677758.1 molybdenum cofactor biosynthesis protein MoaE [Aliidongia sp.]
MIRLQEPPFDVGRELGSFGTGDIAVGAVASFVGYVRGAGAGAPPLIALTLEHYPGMTERQLASIEDEARTRWPVMDLLVIHRHGRLLPGEPIVLVAVSSAHRQAAFEACQFLMDWLKTKAPFWKLEETAAGAEWVAAKTSDDAAADRWKTAPR